MIRALLTFAILSFSFLQAEDEEPDLGRSLMTVGCAFVDYDHYRPWKIGRTLSRNTQACAISKDTIITLASGIKNAKFIQVRLPFQREVVTAEVKFIDYNSNLCILKLDKSKLTEELIPLKFRAGFKKGKDVQFKWFSQSAKSFEGFGKMEDYRMHQFDFARGSFLTYSVSNISSSVDKGTVLFDGNDAIGLTYSSDTGANRAFVLAGEVIAEVLERFNNNTEPGFPMLGFSYSNTAQTTLRNYLGLDTNTGGIYINEVYSLGTGADVLKKGDVVLGFAGRALDAWGRVDLPEYDQINFEFILSQFKIGEEIPLIVFRDGKKTNLSMKAMKFSESETFVPAHLFDTEPRYHAVGGFIFQTLNSEYLREWGGSWRSRSPVDLFSYFKGESLKLKGERKEIVILNHVLPHQANQGYQDLRFKVVKSFNGVEINSLEHLIEAMKTNFNEKYHVVELEKSNPTVVIPKDGLKERDFMISRRYGLPMK